MKKTVDEIEYRMYSIVLTALNPMQKGIQAMHSVVEYMSEFSPMALNVDRDALKKWSEKDKTTIILNGGTVRDLVEFKIVLREHGYGFSSFNEEDLDGIITSVSLLVGSDIYEMTDEERTFSDDDTLEEHNKKWLAQELASKRLAN